MSWMSEYIRAAFEREFFITTAETPREHIKSLWDSGLLPKIVDHRNYNPRIIEAMTDNLRTRNVPPVNYGDAFIHALDNPHQLWDTAFRTHIRAVICCSASFSVRNTVRKLKTLGPLSMRFTRQCAKPITFHMTQRISKKL